jgi:linoleoyl-CoA desaturase
VEHHLFPRISHVHYPAINEIVKETCAKFGIGYNEHRTVFSAVRSHVVHLREIGRRD